ncbi:MAG: polyprenyl synthetase family protein [Flavobacteriales bacterium]
MYSLEDLQALVLKKVEGFCRKNGEESILEPVNYILQLGGKRVRPLLTLLAADAFSDDIDDAVYPAIAMEIFHNFTLMHDDIMDNAPLRRGKPTVHERWNRDVAILSGDAMLIQAYQLIIKTRPECLAQVLETFNTTALEVCKGQQLDMEFQTRNDVTIEEYIEMIRLKTSVLLGGSMKIGAIISNASEEDQTYIYNFAIELGLSFQLWDDYLDTFGDSTKVGKQVGGDILANKKTFLMIKAMELADDAQRSATAELLSSNESSELKVNRVTQLFKDFHLDQLLKSTVENYYKRALENLDALGIDESRKVKIRALAEALHGREF